jgi:ABC-type oligopeptide transport system substrate-binding subunit
MPLTTAKAATRIGLSLMLLTLLLLPVRLTAEVVLHRGNSAEPETLDPHKAAGVWEAHILRDLFEGLLTEAADGTPIPGVADQWQQSSDGTVYTFQLRADARWSNGTPVTAQDFVYSMQRLLDPATASRYATILYPVRNAEEINSGRLKDLNELGVTALDERTLRIALKAPMPYFLQQLTHHTAYPVPRALVEQYGNDWTKPGKLVSNGAYTLAEWLPQGHVKLVRNPTFHAAAGVQIDTVYFYPTEDRSTALKRFRAGELDSNDDIPDSQIEWIRTHLKDELRIAPFLGVYYYAFNLRRPPFNDPRIRRALALAMDREVIVEKITGAGERPAYSLVPPGIANYPDGPGYADFKDWPPEQRTAEALRLLGEAGYGPDRPLKFRLSYNTSENHKKIAIAIASLWKRLGVDVELINTEVKVHYIDLQEGRFDVARAGWIADYNDPQNFLFLLESNNPPLNYAKYSNPDYDRLLAEAAVTVDLRQRSGLLRQAERLALQDMPYAPLYYYVSKSLVKSYLKGWQDNIKNVHPTRFLRLERSPASPGG